MAWGALIRFPQALLGYYDDEDAVADAARKASFTHREATALDGSEFFARVAFRVSRGALPREAIQDVAAASSPFIQKKVAQALAKVDEATDPAQPLSKEDFVDDLALTSMAVWKSTSAPGARGRPGSVERRGTGIATLSSRRRVDGVGLDAAIQDERAVKF